LGWDGEAKRFGLIQLYHRRDSEKTFREPWGRRGPIFSKTGRPSPDWDHWSRLPIYVIDVSIEDVQSGAVLALVRRWLRPIAARMRETAQERANSFQTKVDEMGDRMGDEIYALGQRHDSITNNVARKHMEAPTENRRRYDNGELDLSESQMRLPEPPGGWDKHMDADQGDL
jgi:hypothetical protein